MNITPSDHALQKLKYDIHTKLPLEPYQNWIWYDSSGNLVWISYFSFCSARELVYACIVLFRPWQWRYSTPTCRPLTRNWWKSRRRNNLISWEKQTRVMRLRTWTPGEDSIRQTPWKLPVNLVEESFSNSFQWRSKLLQERLRVLTVKGWKITTEDQTSWSDKTSEG